MMVSYLSAAISQPKSGSASSMALAVVLTAALQATSAACQRSRRPGRWAGMAAVLSRGDLRPGAGGDHLRSDPPARLLHLSRLCARLFLPIWRLLCAAPPVLGRLWLRDPARSGLRIAGAGGHFMRKAPQRSGALILQL